MLDPYPPITIYMREAVNDHFDKHPNDPITLYVPASGSWCETFYSKEQYLKRMEAWDRAVAGDRSGPCWYDLRGTVSHPQWSAVIKL